MVDRALAMKMRTYCNTEVHYMYKQRNDTTQLDRHSQNANPYPNFSF